MLILVNSDIYLPRLTNIQVSLKNAIIDVNKRLSNEKLLIFEYPVPRMNQSSN